MARIFVTFIVIIMIFSFGIAYVLRSLGIMGCIKKAEEDSFKAWIPIYNEYLLYRISGMKGALIAINIVAYISIAVCMGIYVGAINKAFNYTEDGIRNITSSSTSSNSSTNKSSKNTIYSTNNTYKNRRTADDIVRNIEEDESNYDEVDEFDIISKYMVAFMILYCIIMVTSVALFVIRILLAINLAKVFDLGGGYIAGLIIIPEIFLLIVAFGKCKYVGKYKTVEGTSL